MEVPVCLIDANTRTFLCKGRMLDVRSEIGIIDLLRAG
jgi:hypothetical protein